MGVEVTHRDYTSRYTPEVVDWLIGNTGDWQSLGLTLRFSVEKKFSAGDTLLIQGTNDLVLSDGSEWSDYGFDAGDVVKLEFRIRTYDQDGNLVNSGQGNIQRNINSLQGDVMNVDGASLADFYFNSMPGQFQYTNNHQIKLDQVIIYVDKKPEGCVITYGHIKNSNYESPNLNSFIDGTLSRLMSNELSTIDSTFVAMEKIGFQSGMSIRSAAIAHWGKIGTHTYQYRVNIEFMISSFFESLSNFETMTAPSQVFDAESLADNFSIVGYPEWNNPNMTIKNDMQDTKRLGNTGWFNENFNGLDHDLQVLSVEYFDAEDNQITELSYTSVTKVRAVISGMANPATGVSEYGVGFIHLPEDEEIYKNKETGFHQNMKVNSGGGGVGGGVFVMQLEDTYSGIYYGETNEDGVRMNMTEIILKSQEGGTGNVIYEAEFHPTVGFSNYIDSLPEADRNYALWISLADFQLETNFSDRVSLLLDYNKMSKFIPDVGEWNPMQICFYEHPYNGEEPTNKCGDDIFVEDDILAEVVFNIDINDPIPSAIRHVIEVENPETGLKYESQSFHIPLNQFPVDVDGVPQWDYDSIRGFKLVSGDDKNFVKVFRLPENDTGTSKGYRALFGFKVRWEDWILRTGVPNDFLDTEQENNGYHNDWYHYNLLENWKLQYSVYLTSQLDGDLVNYVNSREFSVKDYDSNDVTETQWNYWKHSTNELINVGIDPETGDPLGVILDDEFTRVDVRWNRTDDEEFDVDNCYATICIEVDYGAGHLEFRQLSSVKLSEADNPLKPMEGEDYLVIEALSPTILKTECLVDPTLLIGAIRYKLTARLGCKELTLNNGGGSGNGDETNNINWSDDDNLISQEGDNLIWTNG